MFYCEICSDWMDCWNDCENCEVWREENEEDADKPERGQRAEFTHDYIWIECDDGAEMIAPPPSYFHDKFTAEIHSKIMHSLTPEQWKSLEDKVLKDVAGWGVNNFEPSECEILGNKFDNTNLMEK